MPFEKWTTLSSECSSLVKILIRFAHYFTHRMSRLRRKHQTNATDSVFQNPMLLKKIFVNVDSPTLLKCRLINKKWLTLSDEILLQFLNKNHLEIAFDYSERHHLYALRGESKWWKFDLINGEKKIKQTKKSLENFNKFLQNSSPTVGKFPSFVTFRFSNGDLNEEIPQDFFTAQGPQIKGLTLNLANCWSSSSIGIRQQVSTISKLLKSQLNSLVALYIQSFPRHWSSHEGLGMLFPFRHSDKVHRKVKLEQLRYFQIGGSLVFSKKRIFALIDEIFDASVNLRCLILRTWDFTKGGLFYSTDFMRKCVSFRSRRHDLIMWAPYVCLDPFMTQIDLLEHFAQCNLKVALLYLCEAKSPQLSEMNLKSQAALQQILVRNRNFLREIICNRSELIVLTQLELPIFPKIAFISVGRGQHERRLQKTKNFNDDFKEKKIKEMFDIFPGLLNMHVQMNVTELLGYWKSGCVTFKLQSHQMIDWNGLTYTKNGEKSKILLIAS